MTCPLHPARCYVCPYAGLVHPLHCPDACALRHFFLQFGTSFQMMDAMAGRGQTTKGLWVSKSPKIDDITTLVMDLEGSDSRERGEDDTNFERQSALFAR